jgi:hypothetical protein
MKFWLSALAILVCLTALYAPDRKPRSVSSLPSPISETAGPEMEKLVKAFSGTWSITENLAPDAHQPSPDPGRGEEVWRALPGGMPLIEEYHSKSYAGDGYDSAVIWWNAKAHRYEGVWCAAFNDPGCSPFTAKWEGDNVVMDGEFEKAGETLAWHEVFTFASTTFTQTLDIGKPGSVLHRASSIAAVRSR